MIEVCNYSKVDREINNARDQNEEEWFNNPIEERILGIDQATRDKINRIDKLESVFCKSCGIDRKSVV